MAVLLQTLPQWHSVHMNRGMDVPVSHTEQERVVHDLVRREEERVAANAIHNVLPHIRRLHAAPTHANQNCLLAQRTERAW